MRCRANAILSLKEYMVEQADKNLSGKEGLNRLFDSAISGSLDEVLDEKIKKSVAEKLKEIERGKRDLFF